MIEDKTIKVSPETHKWLRARKEKNGVEIKFTVDLAIEALKEKEKKSK